MREHTYTAGEPNESAREGHGVSRRAFVVSGGTGLAAGAAMTGLAGCALAAPASGAPASGGPGQRLLLKGGVVLTMDPRLGDFENADVLIEGSKIAAVGASLPANAPIVDASNMIVMPGFVDTHRHIWQGQLRNILPNGRLDPDYFRDIGASARNAYRPEDVYVGDLLSAWGAINAGITTLLDWSHISNSPEHSDAAVQGLRESGIRAVYGYGTGAAGPRNQYPQDIRRLRKQYFNTDDQLLTLALATAFDPKHWEVAREVGAPITLHDNGSGLLLPLAKLMGPDVTYIHCCHLTAEEWKLIASSGGSLSLATPIEMEMGHGIPPIQQALDHKIPWSLSNDVETEIPSDFFTQMRTNFFLQRMQIFTRERAKESNVPPLLTVKDIVHVATAGGARANWLDKRTGSLTPGKEADVILLTANAINVTPLNHAYGAIVLGMDTSNVDTVFVGGRVKKWQGQLVGADLDQLRTRSAQSRDYLLAQSKWPRTVLGGYLPGH
ncbi:MAG: amidohydrolase [Candidatus Rokuibacteriota bacterium]|nr:MAG: amidohydrolase [Candidatus Rokubacteria bacterium]